MTYCMVRGMSFSRLYRWQDRDRKRIRQGWEEAMARSPPRLTGTFAHKINATCLFFQRARPVMQSTMMRNLQHFAEHDIYAIEPVMKYSAPHNIGHSSSTGRSSASDKSHSSGNQTSRSQQAELLDNMDYYRSTMTRHEAEKVRRCQLLRWMWPICCFREQSLPPQVSISRSFYVFRFSITRFKGASSSGVIPKTRIGIPFP